MLLLVPSDPVHPRRPDEHFAEEAEAARALGLDVGLVDHDAIVRKDIAAGLARVPAAEARAVYRGWMMRSGEYAAFAEALAARGVALRTGAAMFRRAHELPGWYDELRSVTPESVWTEGHDEASFRACCVSLGRGSAVLRDYTKSMKHYWHEAAFIPDVADLAAAWRVARRFLELREEMFTGGFVLRRFESIGADEVRTWWVDGVCRLQTVHPDSRATEVPTGIDLAALAPIVRGLALPFVTLDLALRDDGAWRVIELGDGQVSDRPRTTSADTFVRALLGG